MACLPPRTAAMSDRTVAGAAIAAAFAADGRRAALMPYLMGGFPDLDAVARRSARPTPTAAPTSSSSACRSPTRSPTGPSIHAAGDRGAARRRDRRRRARACEALAARGPGGADGATRTSCWRAALERFAADAASAGASGLIVPDLPLEEAPAMLAACDAAGLALVPLVAPTTHRRAPGADRRAARAASSTPSRVTGTTGERAALADSLAAVVAAGQGLHRRCRWRSASASRRPSRPPRPRRRAPTA